MKAATLFALTAQVVYVLSAPAPLEDGIETTSLEDRQAETADTLAKRGQCFYKKYPNMGDAQCSKDGWCYGHCNLQGPDNGEWCWHGKNGGNGDYIKCKTSSDCIYWWVKPVNIGGSACKGGCKCA